MNYAVFPQRESVDIVGKEGFPREQAPGQPGEKAKRQKSALTGTKERSWQDMEGSSPARGGVDGAAAGSWPRAHRYASWAISRHMWDP